MYPKEIYDRPKETSPKVVDYILIQTETKAEGIDPNDNINNLRLWELMQDRCSACPDLRAKFAFCDGGDEWLDAQIGLDGLDAIETRHDDLSDDEKSTLSDVRRLSESIRNAGVKFRFLHMFG